MLGQDFDDWNVLRPIWLVATLSPQGMIDAEGQVRPQYRIRVAATLEIRSV
jgi:hypothetical protein